MIFSILIPTRSRPENIYRIMDSLYENSNNINNIEVIFYYDNDDEVVKNNINIFEEKYKIVKFITSNDGSAKYNNWWDYLYKFSTGKYIMQGGDDLVFATKDWDDIVSKKFDEEINKNGDKILLVGTWDGSDAHKNGELITHSIVTKEWIESLGYFTSGLFSANFNDTWLTELAKRINRLIFMKNVLIEHLHPFWGKANDDDVYRKQQSLGNKATSEWRDSMKNIDEHVGRLKLGISKFKI